MKHKRVIIVTAAVLLSASSVWAFLYFRTPSPTSDLASIAKYVATDKFAALPSDKQKAYIDSLMKDQEALRAVDPEVRRAAWEAARDLRERQELQDYFKLSPEDRKKHLDERIKAEEERRKQWQARAATRPTSRPAGEGRGPGGDGQGRPQGGPGGGGGGGGPGGRGSPERQKGRLENTDPGTRAQMSQYRADMAQRRAELGIPGGGGPGGGGGRGPR